MYIINTGTIIEHDCRVSNFTHVVVGSVLCGEVIVGENTLIGANATMIHGEKIGSFVLLGRKL